MDYSRQSDIFNNATFTTPVHVIGAGATGSWVAICLAKLGIKNVTVWDFDTVAEHNIPNQAFGLDDVDGHKVAALSRMIESNTGIKIKEKGTKVDGTQHLDGVVFMLTDTMSSRKDIYERAIRLKPAVKLLIETRMGLSAGRIYTINPTNWEQVERYEKTFYGDTEAQVSACGSSQSVITTAMTIGAMAVRQMINWVNDKPINHELLIDLEYNNVYPQRFEE